MNSEWNVPLIETLLKDIEEGRLSIAWLNKDNTEFCGDARYIVSNGYIITVFIDCGDFDYIDKIEDENGNVIWEFNLGYELGEGKIENYHPSDEVEKNIYGINYYE